MNWELFGATTQAVTTITIILSFIHVTNQNRKQNKEARLTAIHQVSLGFRNSMAVFADEELARLIVKGNRCFDSLSGIETMQLFAAFSGILRSWEETYIRYLAGQLDDHSWKPMAENYQTLMGIRALQHVWESWKGQFNEKFRKFVDELEIVDYVIKQPAE